MASQSRLQKGAGVIVDSRGYIATNTHIILHATRIKVTLQKGEEYYAEVKKFFPQLDLSFLKISSKSKLNEIDWADSDEVNFGDEVNTIGHSSLLKDTFSGGKIVGIAQNNSNSGPRVAILETDMNMYPGDSGGALFDNDGKFLGLISGKERKSHKSVFVIPSNVIRWHFYQYLR